MKRWEDFLLSEVGQWEKEGLSFFQGLKRRNRKKREKRTTNRKGSGEGEMGMPSSSVAHLTSHKKI